MVRRHGSAPEKEKWGWCRHQPPMSRGFGSVPRKAPHLRPRAVSETHSGTKAPSGFSRLPGRNPKVPAVRRRPLPRRSRRAAAGFRHRPGGRSRSLVPPCRKAHAFASVSLGGGPFEPPFPRPWAPASGGDRNRQVRIWLDRSAAVSVRSPVPPGFCRGCRLPRRPGFHLAAASRGGFVSRPRLARSAPRGITLRPCP
jgi:hypothetical protein